MGLNPNGEQRTKNKQASMALNVARQLLSIEAFFIAVIILATLAQPSRTFNSSSVRYTYIVRLVEDSSQWALRGRYQKAQSDWGYHQNSKAERCIDCTDQIAISSAHANS